MSRSSLITLAIVLLLFAAAFWIGGTALIPQQATAGLGPAIPGFKLYDLDDKLRDTTDWQGKVVVLNFWAVWCPPCRAEMPEFIELQEKYGEQGLQFIGIAIDNKESVERFTKLLGVNYPILLGDSKTMNMARTLGNRFESLPFTAIFNRDGKAVYHQIGRITKSTIEETIKPLL